MKLDLDHSKTIIFSVVFACVTFLVYSGKLDSKYLEILIAVLFPSPLQVSLKPSPLNITVSKDTEQ